MTREEKILIFQKTLIYLDSKEKHETTSLANELPCFCEINRDDLYPKYNKIELNEITYRDEIIAMAGQCIKCKKLYYRIV